MAKVSLEGTPTFTNGELPAVGSAAPDFTLVDENLKDVSLGSYADKKKLLSIVPSLDTPVCATSTKKFNERVADRVDLVVLVVSSDLPFAMSRFCKTESTKNIKTLSTMRGDFARDYGVLIEDGPLAGITTRAVVVLDENDVVVHTELVSDIVNEPDYEAALAATR